MARLWILYDKYPWELGYPPYAEFDNLFPLVIKEWNKRCKFEMERQKEFEEAKKQKGPLGR